MSDTDKKSGGPPSRQTFVVTRATSGAAVTRKLGAGAAAPKPKWVVKATVGTPVRQHQTSQPAPAPPGLALPPNLEEIVVRLARPMIREWLEESLPRMMARALKGGSGKG